MNASDVLPVAVGVIVDDRGHILITRRPGHVHQGGLWEFPGGKIEAGENTSQTLARELEEELGIRPRDMRPLITLRHHYPERAVRLEVWRVTAWRGKPRAREGQAMRWIEPADLPTLPFPAANRPIISAARLPDHYLITPPPCNEAVFLRRLQQALEQGVRLVQLRAHELAPAAYARLAKRVLALTRGHGARLLLNAEPSLLDQVDADGIHLSTRRLMRLERRPVPRDRWLAASCHDAAELEQARQLEADFAVLSPLRATASHPGAQPLGWTRFAELVDELPLPVFALGGLGAEDKARAFAHGAQGVAAIRAYWPV